MTDVEDENLMNSPDKSIDVAVPLPPLAAGMTLDEQPQPPHSHQAATPVATEQHQSRHSPDHQDASALEAQNMESLRTSLESENQIFDGGDVSVPLPPPPPSTQAPPSAHEGTQTVEQKTAAALKQAARSASVQALADAKRRENNFLERLWNWLDSEASHGIMQFSVNGRYLLILNPEAVPAAAEAANVCKHKNYESFQRQCCIYGWRRIGQNEVPKLVLDDEEKPGETISRLGDNIKVMQHENLLRDSPREEVRSVMRKAKPKPSRAKDAEARAVANERMAAEQAEREAKQAKQAELVAMHKAEEKRRQDAQRRREKMKAQEDEDEANQDLTYDPALPPAPPLSHDMDLDPSLNGPTGSMPPSSNALTAASTIPKQANSNSAGKNKSSKSKKRKAAADKGENQENQYDPSLVNGDIRIGEELAKRAKKKKNRSSSGTAPFDADSALSSLGMHTDPYSSLSLISQPGANGSTSTFDTFFSNPFDPSHFATAQDVSGSMVSAGQLGLAPSSTHYEALPKSLQEAFLILDPSKSVEPAPNQMDQINISNPQSTFNSSMIDPALTGSNFNTSNLPPLPPGSVGLNTALPMSSYSISPYTASPGLSGIPPPAFQREPTPDYTSLQDDPAPPGYGTNNPIPGMMMAPMQPGLHPATLAAAAPFYYGASQHSTFSDASLANTNQIAPPYFSSAFSGLADLQSTNW